MTQRKTRRTIRPGTRVTDGRGTGTVRNSAGLPPICNPQDWIWIDWDGDRGPQTARIADLHPNGENRIVPLRHVFDPCALSGPEIARSDARIAAYRAAAAALTGVDWERLDTMRAEMAAGTRAPDAAERRRRILETSP